MESNPFFPVHRRILYWTPSFPDFPQRKSGHPATYPSGSEGGLGNGLHKINNIIIFLVFSAYRVTTNHLMRTQPSPFLSSCLFRSLCLVPVLFLSLSCSDLTFFSSLCSLLFLPLFLPFSSPCFFPILIYAPPFFYVPESPLSRSLLPTLSSSFLSLFFFSSCPCFSQFSSLCISLTHFPFRPFSSLFFLS